MKKLIGSLAASALTVSALAAGSVAPAQAAPAAKAQGTTSLAEVLAADGVEFDKNWKDFDIVEAAVYAVLDADKNSPVGILANGKKRVTAFVPTDSAFRRLVGDLTGKKPKTEAAVVKKLVKLFGVDTIEDVLLYHVVPGATINSKKALKADGAALESALGKHLKVKVRGKTIRIIDADRNARNAKVKVADINKGNKQIAHGINQVLRPVDL